MIEQQISKRVKFTGTIYVKERMIYDDLRIVYECDFYMKTRSQLKFKVENLITLYSIWASNKTTFLSIIFD